MIKYNKLQMVMLPTDKESKLVKVNDKVLQFSSMIYPEQLKGFIEQGSKYQYQYLYVLSDEPIKEGDWCLYDNSIISFVKDWKTLESLRYLNAKKIIATIDESLSELLIWHDIDKRIEGMIVSGTLGEPDNKKSILPKEFYRNYYQTDSDTTLDGLVEKGYAIKENRMGLQYYFITSECIKVFRKEFAELVNYKPAKERDENYLRKRIGIYCALQYYNFGGSNIDHIMEEYEHKYSQGIYVSHTTKDVIERFKPELKNHFKKPKLNHVS